MAGRLGYWRNIVYCTLSNCPWNINVSLLLCQLFYNCLQQSKSMDQCWSWLRLLVLHALCMSRIFLLWMKTGPCLSVTDLSPRAISQTQTDSVSRQKSQLSNASGKWDGRRWYLEKLILRPSAATHISTRHLTYVQRDLDVGEGVLGGLCGQGPGAEGGGDGSQTSGWYNFSLRGETEHTQ